jgi:hypothetical protein
MLPLIIVSDARGPIILSGLRHTVLDIFLKLEQGWAHIILLMRIPDEDVKKLLQSDGLVNNESGLQKSLYSLSNIQIYKTSR